ncbi:hypothetical protein X975_04610, partial [Stegodyphus mimosarum]
MPVIRLQEKMKAEEMKALMDMLAALKAGQEEMKQEMKAGYEELAEETGAVKEDAKVPKFASEESEDEEKKEVAGRVSEKDPEIMDETSDVIKERERKHKEIKDENEGFDSQVPEAETEENENAAVKIIETDNEVTKSQLASIERSDEMCSHHMFM